MNFQPVYRDILWSFRAPRSSNSDFQLHRFAQRSFRAIQNCCDARRIRVRNLRARDNAQDSK